jgi:hypothetical protein
MRKSPSRSRPTKLVAKVVEEVPPKSADELAALAEQIDASVRTLVRIAIEMRRESAGGRAAKTIRHVAKALESYRAQQAEPLRDRLTDQAVTRLAEVYRSVRKAEVGSHEYDRRLRAALAPLGIALDREDLRALARSPKQISDVSNAPDGWHSGPKEVAKRVLARHIDGLLARRPGHPVTGEPSDEAKAMRPLLDGPVSPSTLRNRQKAAKDRGELGPVVTSADERAYLAELALDDVERFVHDGGTRFIITRSGQLHVERKRLLDP